MAQSPPGLDLAQFSCSICLELLRDPVTVPCGHSYCMSCLTAHWDRQLVCSCPQCRATFSPRPRLGRNNLLVEMMQSLGAIRLDHGGPSAPPLDMDHGFAHATFDVSSVRPERPGAERLLGETRRNISQQIKDREQEHQQLKQTVHSFSRLAKAAVKDNSRLLSELQDFLERRRVEMKELIRAQEKAEVTRAENQLHRLEQQISELKRREAELEKLTHSRDQQRITQVCQSYSSPVSAAGSSCLTVSPHVSFGPVRTATLELKEQLQTLFHSQFTSVASAVKNVNVLQLEKPNKPMSYDSGPVPAPDKRYDLLHYFTPLSLDPFTAHKELTLTKGNRMVSRTGECHDYPDHPDRFDSWGQVLCREGLQGCCYWEAEWDGQQAALGLTYEGIGRKGSSDHSRLGHNPVSWSVRCSSASSLVYCHGNEEQALVIPPAAASRRIGVFLDHEVGLLCFYTVTPTGVHLLHRVESSFTQPLYPAAWLGIQSSITFCTVD